MAKVSKKKTAAKKAGNRGGTTSALQAARAAASRQNTEITKRRALSANLRTLLRQHAHTDHELAEAIGRHVTQVRRYLRGEAGAQMDTVAKIAEVYGVDPTSLFDSNGPRKVGDARPIETKGVTRPDKGNRKMAGADQVTMQFDMVSGLVDMRFNAQIPHDVAMQILALVRENTPERDDDGKNGNGDG